MLAEAVKQGHADVVFKAPVKQSAAATAPTVALQLPPRRVAPFAAGPLPLRFSSPSSAAAAFSDSGAISVNEFEESQQRLAKAKDELSKTQDHLSQKKGQTQKEIQAIQEQIDNLFTKWKTEETKSKKVIEGQGAQLILRGPQRARRRNNSYEIEVRQKDHANNAGPNSAYPNAVQQNQDPTRNNLASGVPSQAPVQFRAYDQSNNKTLWSQQIDLPQQLGKLHAAVRYADPAEPEHRPGNQDAGGRGQARHLARQFEARLPGIRHASGHQIGPCIAPATPCVSLADRRSTSASSRPRKNSAVRYRILGPKNEPIFTKEVASQMVRPSHEPLKGPDGVPLQCLRTGEILPARRPRRRTVHPSRERSQ